MGVQQWLESLRHQSMECRAMIRKCSEVSTALRAAIDEDGELRTDVPQERDEVVDTALDIHCGLGVLTSLAWDCLG